MPDRKSSSAAGLSGSFRVTCSVRCSLVRRGSSGEVCSHGMVRAGSLPTKGQSSGSESGGSSPEAVREDRHKCYRNAHLCISGNGLTLV